VGSRRATEEETRSWQEDGWVLIRGLVDPAEIDAAADDLSLLFPTPQEYARDPEGETARRLGPTPLGAGEEDVFWPADGPGFRTAQQRWSEPFPFPGTGVLNRLCVHPAVVDFAERALGAEDLRLYQAHLTAKYQGVVNYEQPMHVDQNHSWLPAIGRPPWWHLEGFLYLTDVTEADNPTLVVSVGDTDRHPTRTPVLTPEAAPEIYAVEQAAVGPRGSYLAYRPDVFHRGSAFGAEGGGRITLALAFRRAGQDWVGYQQAQSSSTDPAWTRFASGASPRELALFGFPPPGHPVWDEEVLADTALRYPFLDLGPWREALDRGGGRPHENTGEVPGRGH
jgi:hypothetical protein